MKTDKNELCVICGSDSGISADFPVKDRQFYIESAGQLCENCYKKLYTVTNPPVYLRVGRTKARKPDNADG